MLNEIQTSISHVWGIGGDDGEDLTHIKVLDLIFNEQ